MKVIFLKFITTNSRGKGRHISPDEKEKKGYDFYTVHIERVSDKRSVCYNNNSGIRDEFICNAMPQGKTFLFFFFKDIFRNRGWERER